MHARRDCEVWWATEMDVRIAIALATSTCSADSLDDATQYEKNEREKG